MFRSKIFFPTLLYLLTLASLAVDTVGSNTTFYKYFAIHSSDVAAAFIVIFAFLRFLFRSALHPRVSWFNSHIVFPAAILSGIILTFVDYLTSANFVFGLLRVQYTQLVLVGVFSGVLILLEHSGDWFRKHYIRIVYYTPLYALALALLVDLFPFGVFAELSAEDRFIENIQVVVLLVASYFCIRIARHFFVRKEALLFAVTLGALLVLVFTAGEEISWGQRILRIETPDFIASRNVQNELTLHNLEGFGNKKVSLAYVVIGFLGSILWLVQKKVPLLRKLPYAYAVPPWYTVPYFFLGFLFNFYTSSYAYHIIGRWSEFMESVLYAGIMVTIYDIYRRLKEERPMWYKHSHGRGQTKGN